jgi:hypothetical protein
MRSSVLKAGFERPITVKTVQTQASLHLSPIVHRDRTVIAIALVQART